jgi:phenylalanyl-tRNA synthetase beta chain
VARVIRGIGRGATPIAVQARLTASGMRPISPVVDATNYAMLELGQPLHAFDLHRLQGPGIVVRRAAEGEPLRTLDGVDRVMGEGDLLICDVERPVAVAGVMGGATSEVDEDTVDVLLESASFARTGILRTARRLDLHTEASHRFERGTDPEALEAGAARGAQLMARWAGGTVARGIADAGDTPPRRWTSMRPARASALLAYDVDETAAAQVFDTLRMTHRPGSPDAAIEVEVPGYRVDIDREVDLIEEVARVLGYDRIGTHVPATGQAGGVPPNYRSRMLAVDTLVAAGLVEVRSMSFASEDDLAMTGHTDAVPISNPLAADEGFLRTRLLPGLVHAVARNQARGVGDITIFEVGSVFRLAGDAVDQRQHVGFALAGPAGEHWDAAPRPFDAIDATGVLEAMMAGLGVRRWRLGETPGEPFHPGRSAEVLAGDDDLVVGAVGELHPRLARRHEVLGRLAVCELTLDDVLAASSLDVTVRDVSRFPPVRRDLAFAVDDEVAAGAVKAVIEASHQLVGRCVLFDVFRGAPLREGTKSLAFAVDFRADDRTLTNEETEPAVGAVVRRVREEFGAELRSG